MTGEKNGQVILNTNLDLLASYNVIDVSQYDVYVRFSLEEGSFITNNINKNLPYKGESNLLTINHQGRIIKREGTVPHGILEYFNFSFPDEEKEQGSVWESICYNIFPNIKSPVELKGLFSLVQFESFKGYNCAHMSLALTPKFINLTEDIKQTVSGNGYILFAHDYSIITFMAINSLVDTGSPGLIFRSYLEQEISPSVKQERPVSSEIQFSAEEYFTRY